MKLRSIGFLCFLVVDVSVATSGQLSVVFVNKETPYNRFELLEDGRSYVDHNGDKGTYRKDGDYYILKQDNEEREFQIKGENLVEQNGAEWVRRERLVKSPWTDLSPVNIFVRDRESGKPLTEFGYTYTLRTPTAEFDPLLVRPIAVKSKAGSFPLSAPEVCEIYIRIENPMILAGFGEGGHGSYQLTSDNDKRKIEVLVDVGSVIEGMVVDERTGKPLKGAIVSPIIFTPPLFRADRSRAVETNDKGEFRVIGVDYGLGISVWHPDYFEFNHNGFKTIGKKVDVKTYFARIKLKLGEKLFGVVKDPAGLPLGDVKVSDGAGKQVRTDKDGLFVLRSPRKWSSNNTYQLSFEKERYLEGNLKPESADPDGFSVVLRPQPILTGRVVQDSGEPVKRYEITAGVGREPRSWSCSSAEVTGDERFSLRVRTDWDYANEGKVWIGIKAPGFAIWETTIDVWQGTESITAMLKPGVGVHGSVKRESQEGEITAFLLPSRIHEEQFTNKTSQRQELGRMQTTVTEQGTFRFRHLPPGQYVLAISGPTISPLSTGIVVSNTAVDVGEFSIQGRGIIRGLFKDPDGRGKPMAFADGQVYFEDSSGKSNSDEFAHLRRLAFKTDQNGEFLVRNVPIGPATIQFPFHASADIIDAHVRSVNVVAGKTTEVRFFDSSGDWDVRCEFVVGDGSTAQFSSGTGVAAKRKVDNVTTRDPMFSVELEPRPAVPSSFAAADWDEPDENNQILLRDVHPGRYRLRIGDWLMSRGFRGVLYEADVEIKSGGTKLKIPLGAGCITGRVQSARHPRHMIHVLGVSKMQRQIRHARCDDNGNFCLRYLPEDRYVLYAHDYDAGWSKLSETVVENDITDIGTRTLNEGGTITGSLPANLTVDNAVSVVATHENGISIGDPNHDEAIGASFSISGLWPGQWTVTLKRNEETLGRRVVRLDGVETITLNLDPM